MAHLIGSLIDSEWPKSVKQKNYGNRILVTVDCKYTVKVLCEAHALERKCLGIDL